MRILAVLCLAALVAAQQKREADPDYGFAEYGYGLGPYGYGPSLGPYGYALSLDRFGYGHGFGQYGYGLGHGHRLGYGYVPAIPYHPSSTATSFSNFNLHSRHRREANPGFFPSYGSVYPSLRYGYKPGDVYGFSTSVQHPGYGYSYQQQRGVVLPSYGHYY